MHRAHGTEVDAVIDELRENLRRCEIGEALAVDGFENRGALSLAQRIGRSSRVAGKARYG